MVPLLRASIGESCRKNACQKETVKKPARNLKETVQENQKKPAKKFVRETHQDTVKQTRKKHGKKPEGNLAKTLNMH